MNLLLESLQEDKEKLTQEIYSARYRLMKSQWEHTGKLSMSSDHSEYTNKSEDTSSGPSLLKLRGQLKSIDKKIAAIQKDLEKHVVYTKMIRGNALEKLDVML